MVVCELEVVVQKPALHLSNFSSSFPKYPLLALHSNRYSQEKEGLDPF